MIHVKFTTILIKVNLEITNISIKIKIIIKTKLGYLI